jgi:L-alanine-DL-glutamate epimerase-like enolase superfamily enzyme
VDCAADLACADVIKLKLMKMGGLNALVAGLRHVRACGMRSVLGNGVAGDIGCWMEACVAATHLDNAGEMNGFLKPVTQLFDLPMHIDGGDLILTGEGEVAPIWPAIEDYTLEKRECC